MSRRVMLLGIFVGLSQLSTGCFWHHGVFWRWHCAPCAAPMHCGPVCPPVSACSSPVRIGGPGCAPCGQVGAFHPGPIAGPQPGVPIITNPTPIQNGPMVYPGQELPSPMPVGPKQ